MEKSLDQPNEAENHHLGILSQVTGGRFVQFTFPFFFSDDSLLVVTSGVLEGTLIILVHSYSLQHWRRIILEMKSCMDACQQSDIESSLKMMK